MEDDDDVWRYAILELHARNDDDCRTSFRDLTQSAVVYVGQFAHTDNYMHIAYL